MNQQWLIKNVLKHQGSVPTEPKDGREYLTLDEAQRIVDETVEYLGAHGDDTEYTYLSGHRKRLAHSLTMIPKARGKGESCLDVGSYGYMALWARVHLGYDTVECIEWHPKIKDSVIQRTLSLLGETVEVSSHNFDISQPDWPDVGTHDTVLFFEVLEHINRDPMGVMKRIHSRLKPEGTLVMSVPNAVSYKSLKEFLVGMPPWTYWFYEPDLSHEPRHCFEYTPIVFKALMLAAGLRENAFRTIYAYSEPEHEQDTLEIARSLGIEAQAFGETMIINATRVSDKINLRYPDVLYSPEGYYKNIYPHLRERFTKAVEHFRDSQSPPMPGLSADLERVEGERDRAAEKLEKTHATVGTQRTENAMLSAKLADALVAREAQSSERVELQSKLTQLESETGTVAESLGEARASASDLQRQNHELEARIRELLYTCDCSLSREQQKDEQIADAERARDAAVIEARDTRNWAENLSKDNTQLSAQINELLFTCDCYLKKENEIEPKLLASEAAKDEAVVEARDTRNWAENLSKDNSDLKGQVNELLFACDCYLQQINDPERCVQVIREKRFRSALRVSKSVARKTPVLRTALRPVYRTTKKFIKRRM